MHSPLDAWYTTPRHNLDPLWDVVGELHRAAKMHSLKQTNDSNVTGFMHLFLTSPTTSYGGRIGVHPDPAICTEMNKKAE